MNPETVKRIQAYLQRTLNPGLTLAARPRVNDSVEVTLAGEHVGLVYLIGLVFLVISVFARLSGLAWVYYAFMVPATACLNSTTLTQVGELGKQRVVDNVVGGILVIIATAVAIGYSQ